MPLMTMWLMRLIRLASQSVSSSQLVLSLHHRRRRRLLVSMFNKVIFCCTRQCVGDFDLSIILIIFVSCKRLKQNKKKQIRLISIQNKQVHKVYFIDERTKQADRLNVGRLSNRCPQQSLNIDTQTSHKRRMCNHLHRNIKIHFQNQK